MDIYNLKRIISHLADIQDMRLELLINPKCHSNPKMNIKPNGNIQARVQRAKIEDLGIIED